MKFKTTYCPFRFVVFDFAAVVGARYRCAI